MSLKKTLLLMVTLLNVNAAYSAIGYTVNSALGYPPSGADLTGKLEGTKPIIPKIMATGVVDLGESIRIDFKDSEQFQFADLDKDVNSSITTFDWYCFNDSADTLVTELQSSTPPDLDDLLQANRAKLIPGNFDGTNQVNELAITQTLLDDVDCAQIGFAITPTTETGSPARENLTLIVPSVNLIGAIDVDGVPDYRPISVESPSISDLMLTGQIRDGFELTASYNFTPDINDRQPKNRSVYSYGIQGTTANLVNASNDLTGQNPVLGLNSFTLPALSAADINTIREVSVLAKDGRNVTGNVLTVDTDMTQAEGNSVIGLPVSFEFTLSNDSIVANNADSSILTLTPKDQFGQYVPNLTSTEIGIKILNSSDAVPAADKVLITAFVEETGAYTSTLTGNLSGLYRLLPTYNALPTEIMYEKTITLLAGKVSKAKSTISLSNNSFFTKGTNPRTATLTATLKDEFGNPVNDADIETFMISPNTTFTAIPGSASPLTTTSKPNNPDHLGTLYNWTQSNNVYRATYAAGFYSGDVKFLFNVDGVDVAANGSSPLLVYVDSNPNTAKVDKIDISPNTPVIANSGNTYSLDVFASDQYGNQYVIQDSGQFNISIPPTVDTQHVTINSNAAGDYASNGLLNVTISGKKVGETEITFTPSTNSQGALTTKVEFVADTASGSITFNGSNLQQVNQDATMVATYKDRYGNNVSGTIDFAIDNGANIVSVNGQAGVTSFTFDGTGQNLPIVVNSAIANSATLTGVSADTNQNVGSQIIQFRSSFDSSYISSFTVGNIPVVANGAETQTVEAIIVDKFGVPVTSSDIVAKLIIPDEYSTWVNSTKADTGKVNKTLELFPNAEGKVTFFLNGYSVGDIPFKLVLIADGAQLDEVNAQTPFKLWLLNAAGRTKSMFAKTWSASSAQPRNIVSMGEHGNLIVPTEDGVDPSEYTYTLVSSLTDHTPVTGPRWFTLESDTGLLRMGTGSNAPHLDVDGFPTTVYVYAKYNGVGRADRIWQWTPKRAWVYKDSIFEIGNNLCTAPLYYPSAAEAPEFNIEWRDPEPNGMFFIVPNTSLDRNVKYFARGRNEALGFYYGDSNISRLISSDNLTGARGFTTKTAQIWCTNRI